MTHSTRRVVAITSGHSFGDRLLRRLGEADIHLAALFVTVEHHAPRHRVPDARRRARLARTRARARAWWRTWRRWRLATDRVMAFDSLSDQRLQRALVRSRPDVLVLAGTGIVPPDLLAVPSLVTLNAHPGLLPWVRGVCPLDRALLRGIPLGATVHAVAAGIDTGPIIRRELLPVEPGEHDRIMLSRRLEDRAIDMLAEVTAGLVLRGVALQLYPQSSRHPYGAWVSDDERSRVTALLAEGEGERLYATWRAALRGDVLPNDDEGLPVP